MLDYTSVFLILVYHILPALSNFTIPQNISAPPTPTGFTYDIVYYTPKQVINPVGVYICAIEALAEWSGPAWDSTLKRESRVVYSSPHGIGFGYWKNTVTSPPPFKLSHLLLGLYHTVINMTEEKRFERLTIKYQFDNHFTAVGNLGIPAPSLLNSSNYLGMASDNGNGTVSTGADSGTILNPKYPWLKIEWIFNGRRAQGSDVFTTIMDAIINTAVEPGPQERTYIYGVSSSGNMGMNVHSVSGAPRKLTNKTIQNVLWMIAWHVFYEEKKFEELDFNVYSDGKIMAEGFFMNLRHSGSGGNEAEVTSS